MFPLVNLDRVLISLYLCNIKSEQLFRNKPNLLLLNYGAKTIFIIVIFVQFDSGLLNCGCIPPVAILLNIRSKDGI